jgi:hypothetical protein
MGKSLKYVSEFTFPSDNGYSASAGKTMVKGYARGGAADMKQDKAVVKAAVQKHERAKHPGEPMTKLARGGMAECAMAKGGMAMRKQYPTDRKEPLITRTKAPAAPAPKSDMLYSKKEVNAKNLLSEGKAPSLPHAKGSVNMKKGGPVKKADGGAVSTATPSNARMIRRPADMPAPSGGPMGGGRPIQQVATSSGGGRPVQQVRADGRPAGGPRPETINVRPAPGMNQKYGGNRPQPRPETINVRPAPGGGRPTMVPGGNRPSAMAKGGAACMPKSVKK